MPLASMTNASSGTETVAPTAWMMPFRITTVPDVNAGPADVTIRPPVMAYTCGASALACAIASTTASAVSTMTVSRRVAFMVRLLRSCSVAFIQRVMLVPEVQIAPRDDYVGHIGADLQRVALGHEQVRLLARLDAAEAI